MLVTTCVSYTISVTRLELEAGIDDADNEKEPGAVQKIEEQLLRVGAQAHGDRFPTSIASNRVCFQLLRRDDIT